ncbi:hypothetical protein MTR_2g071930 [Medicago truncatula]|uniref:Uncharacterized protein n=1 Tax=Medicago truncatula TaxID=3880 RepID=A0A072V9G9_MEDTR|nr:hypothetical protein MTR_2g071930 [Medicago truncatula]
MITEIITEQTSEDDIEVNKVMFPKLHLLELECLPGLISFCSVPLAVENYEDTRCMALIDQKVGMSQLETLKLSKINSWKLWDDIQSGYSCVQNLTNDEMADAVPILVFPKLTSLSLRSLAQLTSFCYGLHTLGLPFLRDLDVYHCDQLEQF